MANKVLRGVRWRPLAIVLCLLISPPTVALGEDSDDDDLGEPISTFINCSVHYMIKGSVLKDQKTTDWAVTFLQGAAGAGKKKGIPEDVIVRAFKKKSKEVKALIKEDEDAFVAMIHSFAETCDAYISDHAYEGAEGD